VTALARDKIREVDVTAEDGDRRHEGCGIRLNDEVAFVVVSCDKYKDLWPIFFNCFRQYWPGCRYRVFLITNELRPDIDGVEVINAGPDCDYGSHVQNSVAKIDAEWLILWLEDCIFTGPVDDARLARAIGEAIADRAAYAKLSADYPWSYDTVGDRLLGSTPLNVRYRAAVGMSLYRRDMVFSLFRRGLSAWQLDKSTTYGFSEEMFLCLRQGELSRPLIPYVNAVIKGKWSGSAFRKLKSMGFVNDLAGRKRQGIVRDLVMFAFDVRLRIYRSLRRHWFEPR
jgi:hypothetical protein